MLALVLPQCWHRLANTLVVFYTINKIENLTNTNCQTLSTSLHMHIHLLIDHQRWSSPQFGSHKLNVDVSRIEGYKQQLMALLE